MLDFTGPQMEHSSKVDIELKVVTIAGAFTYHSAGGEYANNLLKLKPNGREYFLAKDLPYLSKAGYNVKIVGDVRPIAESLSKYGVEYTKRSNNTELEIT